MRKGRIIRITNLSRLGMHPWRLRRPGLWIKSFARIAFGFQLQVMRRQRLLVLSVWLMTIIIGMMSWQGLRLDLAQRNSLGG